LVCLTLKLLQAQLLLNPVLHYLQKARINFPRNQSHHENPAQRLEEGRNKRNADMMDKCAKSSATIAA